MKPVPASAESSAGYEPIRKSGQGQREGKGTGPGQFWTRLPGIARRSAALSCRGPVIIGGGDLAPVDQPLVPVHRVGAGAAPAFFAVEEPAKDARFEKWWRLSALVGFPDAAEGRQQGDAGRND